MLQLVVIRKLMAIVPLQFGFVPIHLNHWYVPRSMGTGIIAIRWLQFLWIRRLQSVFNKFNHQKTIYTTMKSLSTTKEFIMTWTKTHGFSTMWNIMQVTHGTRLHLLQSKISSWRHTSIQVRRITYFTIPGVCLSYRDWWINHNVTSR